jgi:hypothetical protein
MDYELVNLHLAAGRRDVLKPPVRADGTSLSAAN